MGWLLPVSKTPATCVHKKNRSVGHKTKLTIAALCLSTIQHVEHTWMRQYQQEAKTGCRQRSKCVFFFGDLWNALGE